MKLLTEIFHRENLEITGKVVPRNAVRGIIFDRDRLLMIFSEKNGDYKFPGGGVKFGEDQRSALMREIREESGVEFVRVECEFGKVIEYDKPYDEDFDVFKMTSRYFICSTGSEFGEQELDPYEEDLGFRACWVTVQEALHTNRTLFSGKFPDLPRWVKREIFVLGQLIGRC